MDFTFGSLMTDEGKVKVYLGEGASPDPVPDNFFGVAGVAEIRDLQDVLLHIGMNGHRHHVSITPGCVPPAAGSAGHYLNFEVAVPQEMFAMLTIAEIMWRARALGIAIPAFNIPYLPMIEPVVQAVVDQDAFAWSKPPGWSG